MKRFVGCADMRGIVLHLGVGERIVESIELACRESGIRDAAVISAIGSARRMYFHRIESTADEPVNTFITIEDACEIGSIQGLILNGEAHLHVSFSDRNHAYNGHLEPGSEVQYLLEVALVELRGLPLKRATDQYGVNIITERQGEE